MSVEKEYWSSFYKDTEGAPLEPSNFGKEVFECLSDSVHPLRILDAGCGNGRDSYYLGKHHEVIGVDSSGFLPENTESVTFIDGDFVNLPKDKFDVIYSRFTLHSLTDEQQEKFIQSIQKEGTYLFIETRSLDDKDGYRYHGDGHFRNFSDYEGLKTLLEQNGFKIHHSERSKGFAPYKDEDPVCIRVFATKE